MVPADFETRSRAESFSGESEGRRKYMLSTELKSGGYCFRSSPDGHITEMGSSPKNKCKSVFSLLSSRPRDARAYVHFKRRAERSSGIYMG